MRLSSSVAHHEAGHSIGAEVMGLTTLAASIVPNATTGGRVEYEDPGPPSKNAAAVRARARRNAITSLAGPCAESHYTSESLWPILQQNPTDLQIARREASLFALAQPNWHRDARVAVFSQFVDDARALVEENWELIEVLARKLQLNPNLDGGDIARVMYLTKRQLAASKLVERTNNEQPNSG